MLETYNHEFWPLKKQLRLWKNKFYGFGVPFTDTFDGGIYESILQKNMFLINIYWENLTTTIFPWIIQFCVQYRGITVYGNFTYATDAESRA